MKTSVTQKISVVVPTYQGERFLLDTLDSISKQTVRPTQVIVTDDGSTDGTAEVIETFKQNAQFEIEFLRHDNFGPTANYLHGIRRVSGDIVVMSDQDDVWLPTRLERICEFFDQYPDAVLCSHDSFITDENLNLSGQTIRSNTYGEKQITQFNNSSEVDNFRWFLRGGLPFLAHTLAFRKKLIPALINKPENIENWWFEEWLTAVAAVTGKLGMISEPLIYYRQHEHQTSGGINSNPKQNDPHKFTDGSQKTVYKHRIERMEYLLTIVDHPGKKNELAQYIQFLKGRHNIVVGNSVFKSITFTIKNLFRGTYSRYAKGVKSFVLDNIRILKT